MMLSPFRNANITMNIISNEGVCDELLSQKWREPYYGM